MKFSVLIFMHQRSNLNLIEFHFHQDESLALKALIRNVFNEVKLACWFLSVDHL